MSAKLDTYKLADTSGKSQLELLIQVYDGAIRSFTEARRCYGAEEAAQGYEHMEQARRFITHLYTTLDFERGGDIAQNLSKLYVHLLNEISVIEAAKDLGQIDDNVRVLTNLREGWVGIRPAAPKTAEKSPAIEPAQSEVSFVTSA
jgi:flagellar protein FliS